MASKPRTGIPGVPGLNRVVNEASWGEDTATERYGGGTRTFPPPEEQAGPQKLGDPANQQGNRYGNNTRPGWLRGSNEDATTKENFDSRDKNGPKKW